MPTDTQALDAVIAALEKATGPSRELDALIWCAMYGYRFIALDDAVLSYRDSRFDNPLYVDMGSIDCVTASLDIAVWLVPEGWSWRIGNLPSRRAFADLGTQPSLQCVKGATAPIALCIAALKARRALAQQESGAA